MLELADRKAEPGYCSPLKKQTSIQEQRVEREREKERSHKECKGREREKDSAMFGKRERERKRGSGEYDENLLLMQSRREALEKEAALKILFLYTKGGTKKRNGKSMVE